MRRNEASTSSFFHPVYTIAQTLCSISVTKIHVAVLKGLDLVFGFFTGKAVNLPDSPRKPITMSCNRVELSIGQSAPLPQQVSSHLRPVFLYEAPIHLMFLVIRGCYHFHSDQSAFVSRRNSRYSRSAALRLSGFGCGFMAIPFWTLLAIDIGCLPGNHGPHFE